MVDDFGLRLRAADRDAGFITFLKVALVALDQILLWRRIWPGMSRVNDMQFGAGRVMRQRRKPRQF